MSGLWCENLDSAQDFVRIWRPLTQLRRVLECERDVLTDPLHFLAATDGTRRSCSIACWSSDSPNSELIGVLFATSHYIGGIPTGYAVAGDAVGRGSLLCRPEHQELVIAAAARYMLASRVHSLHLRVAPTQASPVALKPPHARQFAGTIPGDRIALPANYDEFLADLGKHTRRNIRYYTRRAEAAGLSFCPQITASEYDQAVQRLNRVVAFPHPVRHLQRDNRLLEMHQTSRFALRDASGEIVAALCGFSTAGRFHLLTQLNDPRLASLSLSLVLRGFTIEYLIATGHTELQFMGGSSLSLGRFCPSMAYRSLFFDRRRGLTGMAKSLAGSCVRWLDARKLHVPSLLEPASGSWLADARLLNRTPLAYAALVNPRGPVTQLFPAVAAPIDPLGEVPDRSMRPPTPDLTGSY
jgi:Acetyltransferase (GNAT) domain